MAKRRGQAAMEFLMTYGWAVLVVLIVIGALAYFGVLNPQRLLPEKCTLLVGLYCNDHRVTTVTAGNVGAILKVENGMGRDVSLTRVYVNETSTTPLMSCGNSSLLGNISLGNGEETDIRLHCTQASSVVAGNKYKFDIEFDYHFDDASFPHTGHGELFATVE